MSWCRHCLLFRFSCRFAALLVCVWGGSTRFGSCTVGGLTWPGSCRSCQFPFVATMLVAIAFAAFLGLLFLNSVLCPGSWTLEEVVSFQEGKAEGKRQCSEEHLIGSMTSYLFTPQLGRWEAAFPAALILFP